MTVGKEDTGTRREIGEFLTKFVELHVETEQMKNSARSSRRNIAILKPQIPIGAGPSAGWFGGNAALPEGMAWPERDGKRLLFVGQIDLAALPPDIWSGAGPRSGWLGIFLPADGSLEPTALHFDGPLVEAMSPHHLNASWTRIYDFKSTRSWMLPKWPLVVETRPGNEQQEADAAEAVESTLSPSLLDPAYHPFDRETVSLLCKALAEAVTGLAQHVVRSPAMKKMRPTDAMWFERQRPLILDTFVRFFEVEGRMRAAREFDADRIAGFIDDLAELDAYDVQYPRNDEEGYCDLVLRETKLLDRQPKLSNLRLWWDIYEAGLTSHAIKAYTSNPASLPAPLRDRLEKTWKNETRNGLAAMGHAPMGHIYTPHGPDSPNEVLLELHTSTLAGWIWGDCYSLVLLINRDALRRGDFSAVTFDITN